MIETAFPIAATAVLFLSGAAFGSLLPATIAEYRRSDYRGAITSSLFMIMIGAIGVGHTFFVMPRVEKQVAEKLEEADLRVACERYGYFR
jgi:predicted membrane protein